MKLDFENGNYCGSRKAWNAKRVEILQRAQNCCEGCGVKNYAVGYYRNSVLIQPIGRQNGNPIVYSLSLIHISEPTRPRFGSRMPSSA